MKTLIVLFLLLSTAFIPQSPPESPELKEATDLTTAAVKLFSEQKLDGALKNVKRALEIRETLLPRTDPRVAESLGQAGNLYFAKSDYDNARKIFERLLAIQEERFGPEHSQVADTLYALGQSSRLSGRPNLALNAYKRSLMIYGRESGVKTPSFERASISMRCLATMKAVQKARFSPTVVSGQPVKVTGFVQYNFVIR